MSKNFVRRKTIIKKGKSTDALMRHIRSQHQVVIGGSKEKRELLEMGYYHGYKTYRFLRNVNDPFENESLFSIYLNRYKEFKLGSSKYKNEMKQKLLLKQKFDSIIANNYQSKTLIQHYIHNGEPIPLWAIFELLTLGDYGWFILCLNTNTRLRLEKEIGIVDKVNDTDGSMLPKHIFIIKELRNSIAHNSVIFDCRFKSMKIRNTVLRQLTDKTGIDNITFDSIVDYLILIIYYQKNLGKNNNEMYMLIKNVKKVILKFKNSVSNSVCNKVLGSDFMKKIGRLNEFV